MDAAAFNGRVSQVDRGSKHAWAKGALVLDLVGYLIILWYYPRKYSVII